MSGIVYHIASYWTAQNPILNANQLGIESDTGVTKIGDGVSAWNSLAYQDTVTEYTTTSGTDTYVATMKMPLVLGYFSGMRLRIRFGATNTGASTINLNGFGAVSIKKNVSSALVAGDIVSGGIYDLAYDGTNFQMMSPVGGSGFATPTLSQVLAAGNTTGANDISINSGQSITSAATTRNISLIFSAYDFYIDSNDSATGRQALLTASSFDSSLQLFSYDNVNVSTLTNYVDYGLISSDKATYQGYKYNADYSANYTARSLVDKAYADSLVASLPTGSGAATRMAYWSAASVLTSSANLTTDGNSLTVGTSVISPIIQGSTAASGTLTLRATSNATDGAIIFQSDSTTERARILSTGELILGASTLISSEKFSVQANANSGTEQRIRNTTSGTAAYASQIITGSGGSLALYHFSAAYTSSGINVASTSVLVGTDTGGMNIGTSGAYQFSIWTNNTKKVEVSSVGNMSLGGIATRATTVGTNAIQIFNGTAPVGTLTNGISIYSSAGECYIMDAAGNATLQSPHEKGTNLWIFKSTDTRTGKVLKIDMEKMMRAINDKFGWDFIHEYIN